MLSYNFKIVPHWTSINPERVLRILVVPGTEELSGDDDVAATPPRHMSNMRFSDRARAGPKPKLKRPKILKRRGSRSHQIGGKDWGERCIDVFEVIAQIGEGGVSIRT